MQDFVPKKCRGFPTTVERKPALVHWALTHHLLGEYAAAMQQRSYLVYKTDIPQQDCLPSRPTRDEQDVQKIVSHIESNMTNPFALADQEDLTLAHLATCLHASDDVQQSLLGAVDSGQQQANSFMQSCLSTGGFKSFNSPNREKLRM